MSNPPKGLQYIDNFITPAEANDLLQNINQQTWDTKLSVKSQHYGYKYTSTTSFYMGNDKLIPHTPIPNFIQPLLTQIQQKIGPLYTFDHLMINQFKASQGFAPHIDHIKLFKDKIAVLSLQAETTIQFKNKIHTFDQLVKINSLYVMEGSARYDYTHQVLPQTSNKKDTTLSDRISLVFRQVK